MKKLFLILIASFALVMAHYLTRVFAWDHDGDHGHDSDGGIALSKLAGKYAVTFPGSSLFICFKPDFSATENCLTTGAVPVSVIGATVAQETKDKDGNFCTKNTFTVAFSAPLAAFPPTVTVFYTAGKVTNYDPATASGDVSLTNYTGGKCIGSKFDSTGADGVCQLVEKHLASGHGAERL
jgi:hypothetical protein